MMGHVPAHCTARKIQDKGAEGGARRKWLGHKRDSNMRKRKVAGLTHCFGKLPGTEDETAVNHQEFMLFSNCEASLLLLSPNIFYR